MSISNAFKLALQKASNMFFDDSSANLGENNIQGALDKAILLNDGDNKIINGDFSVWQRGTSHTSSGYGSADRFRNSFAGGSVTSSQQTFGLGDTIGGNLSPFYFRQTVSGQSSSNDYAGIQQRIEDVRSYAGQTITILFWARRSAGSGNISTEILQRFGTGGSPSAEVITTVSGQTVIDGTWAAYAVTVDVPSISGKVIGTAKDDYFAIFFWTSAGSDFNARANSLGLQTITVDLWGIHIRRGVWPASAAQLYRPRQPGVELALCQRYYQTGFLEFSGSVTSVSSYYARTSYLTTMRAAPSGVFTNIQNNGFAATVGSTYAGASNVLEIRTANATSASGRFLTSFANDAEL